MPDKIIVCPKCKEKLTFKIEESIIDQMKNFPVPCVIQHKDHFIILYLDSQYSVTDLENPVFFKSV